jgi:hypothetical protein
LVFDGDRLRCSCAEAALAPHLLAPAASCAVRRQFCQDRSIVECWIGVVQEEDRRVLRLAGRLGEAQVPELLRACADAGPLQLDLSDLVSADRAGLEAVQRIQARGVVLVGVPGYIQLQLDSPSRSRIRGSTGKQK